MLGLFGTLNLGARSLSVQQEATAVAGQNLANVNNAAYSRQKLVIQAATTTQTSIGQEGNGIQAISISQIRDAMLDNQIQQENSVTGSLGAQQTALENAEGQLGETLTTTSSGATSIATSSTGLTADIGDLFTSFSGVTNSNNNNSGDLATRTAAISAANDLAQEFNTVSSGLAGVQAQLNSSISNDVAASNQDMKDIASLNQQIVRAEAIGGTANDLVDERQAKLEDLASKVNVTATTQSDGSMNLTIGGVTMVSEATVSDSLQAYDSGNGNLMVKAQNAGTQLSITGGSIGGAIETRDGALAALQTSVNTLASQLITQVNNIYSQGYDSNGNTGASLFTGTDASDIAVNSTLLQDASQFQAAGAANAPGDTSVALALTQLGDQSITGLNNQTFGQNYAQTVGNLGAALSSVNDQVANSSSVSQMLTNQRSSVSGVSTDEEMTNLIEFQKAYQASAELISTLNQMLETLITMKTV
jgi:flagellar hook-associated protein 1 FlgK